MDSYNRAIQLELVKLLAPPSVCVCLSVTLMICRRIVVSQQQ